MAAGRRGWRSGIRAGKRLPHATAIRDSRGARWWVAGSAIATTLLVLAVVWSAPPTAPPDPGDVYREAVVDEPPLLNPLLGRFTATGQDVLPLVFASLVRAAPDGSPQPDLAERWETVDGGKTYAFYLRPGLRWDDGAPLTSADVTFTVDVLRQPGLAGGQDTPENWTGVAVSSPDERTVIFSLPERLASFPDHLTFGLLPEHILAGTNPANLSLHAFNRRPVGSGPYRVASFEPDRLLLERSPTYFGWPPRQRQIELRFFKDRPSAIDSLTSGHVDGMTRLQPEEVDRVSRAGSIAVYSVPERAKAAVLALNLRNSLLSEQPVRQAIARSIDRDALIRRALRGQAEPAYGPIPLQSWAYARPSGAGDFDLAAAAEVLDAAGWRAGADGIRSREGAPLAFTILASDSPERIAVAREIATQLGRVGFGVRVRALPADELDEDFLQTRRFEAVVVGQWSLGTDPDVYSQWHSSQATQGGGNLAGFASPDVDRWLEAGRQEDQLDERRNAYLHFQARWADEQPSIVLYSPLYTFAVNKAMRGVRADPLPDSSWQLRQAAEWYRQTDPARAQSDPFHQLPYFWR